MKQLSMVFFPVVGMKNLKFITKDGKTHIGKYDFNESMARRWFDKNGNQYTSDNVIMWEEKE